MNRKRVVESKTLHDTEYSQEASSSSFMSYLALVQSVYFAATGIWPLFSIGTFEKVTGPKADHWLVQTVGVLVTIIGAVLAVSGLRRKIPPETVLLAVGSALGLAGVDLLFVAKKRISRIYLLDAVAEVILVALWILAWNAAAQERSTRAAE